MTQFLNTTVKQLVDTILDYKSSDFIGDPTPEEVHNIAALIIQDRAEEIGYSVDGDMLTRWLEEVRGDL